MTRGDATITITFKLDAHQRRAIQSLYGRRGMASEATVKAWAEETVMSTLEDIQADYEKESS